MKITTEEELQSATAARLQALDEHSKFEHRARAELDPILDKLSEVGERQKQATQLREAEAQVLADSHAEQLAEIERQMTALREVHAGEREARQAKRTAAEKAERDERAPHLAALTNARTAHETERQGHVAKVVEIEAALAASPLVATRKHRLWFGTTQIGDGYDSSDLAVTAAIAHIRSALGGVARTFDVELPTGIRVTHQST